MMADLSLGLFTERGLDFYSLQFTPGPQLWSATFSLQITLGYAGPQVHILPTQCLWSRIRDRTNDCLWSQQPI